MRTQTRSHELRPFLETPEAKRTPARARPLSQPARPKLHQEAKSASSPPTSAAPAAQVWLRVQRVRRFLSAAQLTAPKEDSPRSHTQSAIPIQPLPTAPAAFCERGQRSPERAEPYKWSSLCHPHVAKPTRS